MNVLAVFTLVMLPVSAAVATPIVQESGPDGNEETWSVYDDGLPPDGVAADATWTFETVDPALGTPTALQIEVVSGTLYWDFELRGYGDFSYPGQDEFEVVFDGVARAEFFYDATGQTFASFETPISGLSCSGWSSDQDACFSSASNTTAFSIGPAYIIPFETASDSIVGVGGDFFVTGFASLASADFSGSSGAFDAPLSEAFGTIGMSDVVLRATVLYDDPPATGVSVPATSFLFGLGLAGLGWARTIRRLIA